MPGSLIYTGEQHLDEVRLELIRFNEEVLDERLIKAEELPEILEEGKVCWLNIVGLHDIELMQELAKYFNIHNLAMEDILNINQRPVFDEYEDHFFCASKMLRVVEGKIISEQFSLVVGKGFILTFQERDGDVFEGVRTRLKKPKGRIRARKADYLAFALLDVIVDHYLGIIEVYSDEIHDQETELMTGAQKDMLIEINLLKKEINFLRKYARPLKDAVINFGKSESDLIDRKTRPFLKDLQEHITHVMESIEVYRETINDNLSTYHTHMTNKLNDILKVLTIFSVVFIPLTFMAGIYGMNFEHMPELSYRYAYPIFWGVLVLVTLTMILFFRRKKWI